MHQHFPSLLIRAITCLRDVGHFLQHFVRSLNGGLVLDRILPLISFRRPDGEPEIKERDKVYDRSRSSTAKDEILTRTDEFVPVKERDLAGASFTTRKASGRRKNKNLIISIHIPKTGGTTFVDVLRKCAEEVLYLDYGPEGLAPTALFRRGKRLTAPFDSIIEDLELLRGRSVIHGHFAPKKYRGRFPNATYVTWLRDPAERVVSHYLYWQRSYLPTDARWEQVVMQKMSLEQFARLDFARDVYFRWFSPLGVEGFDFVGIMEEYDRSLELFRRLVCPDIQLDTTLRNYNPNRRGNFYDLGPELRRKILELNQRDAYIYLDGVRRFRNLCAQVGLTCWSLLLQFGYRGESDYCDYLSQFFC